MELKACPHRDKEQFTIWQGEHRTRVYKCTCPDLKPLHDLVEQWEKQGNFFTSEKYSDELRKALKQMEGK